MEYKSENISPTKVKAEITVNAEEVNAALTAQAVVIQQQAQLDGFRKGKAPLNLIIKRFHDQIQEETRNDLINANINEVLAQLHAEPVSGIVVNGVDKPLNRDEPFTYSMEFEVLPDFELPPYAGLEAEEEKVEVDEAIIDKMYDRMRQIGAKLIPVEGIEPAKDGQIANIDFEVIENGVAIPDLKTVNFDLSLGIGSALPEFENFVKSLPVGNTGEKEIEFPADFVDKRLAGKKVVMKVTVNAVKEYDTKGFDEALQAKGAEEIAKLRKTLGESYTANMKKLRVGATQRKLLDQLLKMVDVIPPESFVEWEQRRLLAQMEDDLAGQGRALSATGKKWDELLAEVKPDAERLAATQTLLMKIARKENLSVSDQEVANEIYRNCMENGEDFQSVFKSMKDNGLIYRLRDHLRADKAMDLIYEKANIKMIEPVADKQAGDEAATE